MIDLEDLPRLESLSPIKDVNDEFQRLTETFKTTKIRPVMSDSLNNGNLSLVSVNNISLQPNVKRNSKDNSINICELNPLFIGGGLRYISQVSEILYLKLTKLFKENCNLYSRVALLGKAYFWFQQHVAVFIKSFRKAFISFCFCSCSREFLSSASVW